MGLTTEKLLIDCPPPETSALLSGGAQLCSPLASFHFYQRSWGHAPILSVTSEPALEDFYTGSWFRAGTCEKVLFTHEETFLSTKHLVSDSVDHFNMKTGDSRKRRHQTIKSTGRWSSFKRRPRHVGAASVIHP